MTDYKVEFIPISDLKPYPENTKIHTPKQIKQIAESIRQFGFRQNIVVDKDGVIVIGHGRFEAAKSLGLDSVPCVRIEDLTDEQIKALRIIDNKTNESEWDFDNLNLELESLDGLFDFEPFDLSLDGFDDEAEQTAPLSPADDDNDDDDFVDDRDPSCQHNVFENQDCLQFPCIGFYGIPEMQPTQTVGDKMLRFMDWKEIDNPEEYIAHFYYDDYKFISAWREPDKYVERLKQFKAVVSPDFSLYTDFPRALQILSCYRRQWCGAYWQSLGIDVIPDVVWGDKESFAYCFDGIPKGGTVAVSSVGVKRDNEWNNKSGDMFKAGYDEMLKRLEPTTILFYGDMIDGLEGNIIQIPSYYAQKREILNERKRLKDGQRKQ